jgi:hypothetical protein
MDGADAHNESRSVWGGRLIKAPRLPSPPPLATSPHHPGRVSPHPGIGEEQNEDHVVVEESKLVINGPQFVHKCKNLSLMRNYQRIKQEGEKLQFIKYCHVLRHLNTKADSLAKEDQSI